MTQSPDRTQAQVLFVINHVLSFMNGTDAELTITLKRDDQGLTWVNVTTPEPEPTPETAENR